MDCATICPRFPKGRRKGRPGGRSFRQAARISQFHILRKNAMQHRCFRKEVHEATNGILEHAGSAQVRPCGTFPPPVPGCLDTPPAVRTSVPRPTPLTSYGLSDNAARHDSTQRTAGALRPVALEDRYSSCIINTLGQGGKSWSSGRHLRELQVSICSEQELADLGTRGIKGLGKHLPIRAAPLRRPQPQSASTQQAPQLSVQHAQASLAQGACQVLDY